MKGKRRSEKRKKIKVFVESTFLTTINFSYKNAAFKCYNQLFLCYEMVWLLIFTLIWMAFPGPPYRAGGDSFDRPSFL